MMTKAHFLSPGHASAPVPITPARSVQPGLGLINLQRRADATHDLHGGVIQRQIDISNAPPLLRNAIQAFNTIDSDDLTQAEFAALSAAHQRFMPLFGRFATVPNLDLEIAPAGRGITGDLAVTKLLVRLRNGSVLDYDKKKTEFHAAYRAGDITRFKVKVLFRDGLVTGAEVGVGSLKNVGTILQALTHELAVHAENMLDMAEQYSQGAALTPLGSASQEHAAFTGGNVVRYEHISARVAAMGDADTMGGLSTAPIKANFANREFNDKQTAK